MNKKKLILAGTGLCGFLLILFITLVVHVGMVSVVKKNDKRMRQLSRIDFPGPLTPAEAADISGFVTSLNGVSGAHVNNGSGILTYMYDPALQNSAAVYKQLMAHGNYQAVKYTVQAEDLAKGCPAFAEKGGFSRAVLYCSNLIFN